ncbi:hypothetical protein G4B88_000980 [Cannabis sativa]|uniref:SET domain-containing protein n=1 Tax=Cannabis sativa TaxID=3483 RepID=A0A7J6FDH3_CANSA|nr:hypothetical protein G4B88_000980 [Cannabis sativa]
MIVRVQIVNFQFVKTLAKNPTFARDPRKLQYDSDTNRLFLYTSYNRLGKNAEEADVEEIIDMASKALFSDQEKLVQENVHSQIKSFCMYMDEILLNIEKKKEPNGLSFSTDMDNSPSNHQDVSETRPLRRAEVSQTLKDLMGYTLEIKPSQIPHKEAGQGLFLDGEAEVGAVVAIYPGVIYSPACYRYIPGYPTAHETNPHLITRYDGNVINAQPWGLGDETREVWDASTVSKVGINIQGDEKQVNYGSDVIERRNPLAFAHYANHPAKGVAPNIMVCPYDFPLTDKDMRVYIPNVAFRNLEDSKLKGLGSSWFKNGSFRNAGSEVPLLKALVLVSTRALCNEELLLNYRWSNLEHQPEWYTPIDEEEDTIR